MKSDYLPITSVATIISGGTPKTSIPDYWDGNIPWLSVKDFNNDSKFVYSTEKRITELGLKNSSTNLLKADDIIISARGTVGKLAMIPFNMTFNQSCFGIRADIEKILPHYLYYALKNNIQTIKCSTHGSVFDTITLKDFDIIKINVPNLETQKKVVKVLSVLDQKIELNNQQNDTLFNIIKSIFRQQFYQKGSDCPLSDYILTEINGDWGKDKKEDGTEKVYCIRGADIPDMEYGYKGNAPNRFVLEKRLEKKSLSEDDIIIEISGGSPTQSTGRTAYITQEIIDMYDAPLLCTNFCKAIKVKDRIFAPFIYMYLKLLYEDDILFNWENGTTGIKNLALSSLLFNTKVQPFSKKEVKRFYDQFYSIVNKISENSANNMDLIQMRDTLLPKLMSDKINLGNVNL